MLSSFDTKEFLAECASMVKYSLPEFVIPDRYTYNQTLDWIRSVVPLVKNVGMEPAENVTNLKHALGMLGTARDNLMVGILDGARGSIAVYPTHASINRKKASLTLRVIDEKDRSIDVVASFSSEKGMNTVQVQVLFRNIFPAFESIEEVEDRLLGVPLCMSDTEFVACEENSRLLSAAGCALLAAYLQEICRPTRVRVVAQRLVHNQSIPSMATGLLLMALELNSVSKEVIAECMVNNSEVGDEMRGVAAISERDANMVMKSKDSGQLSLENFIVPGSNLVN